MTSNRKSVPHGRARVVGVIACIALVAFSPDRAAATVNPLKTFTVSASKYEFTPARIEVSEGDTVKLILRSTDVTHGIEIKEFGVKVKIPKGGQPVSVEFVANKAGTFEFRCSEYCGSGHRRMRGKLVVLARGQ